MRPADLNGPGGPGESRALVPTGAPTSIASVAGTATGPAAGPPAPAGAIDILELLRALQRRWKLALVLGMLGATVVGLVVWYVTPPAKYTAVTILQIAPDDPKLIFTTQENRVKFEIFQKTQLALIKSRLVLDAVLKEVKVARLPMVQEASRAGDPIEWLENSIVVDFPPNSEILQISLSGDRPEDLATLVNAVTDVYMNQIVDRTTEERIRRQETLRESYMSYQNKMKEKRSQVRRLAVSAGSDDRQTLALKGQLMQQQLALTNQERLKVRTELMRLKAESESLKTLGPAVIDPTALAEAIEEDLGVRQLRDDLARLQNQYQANERLAKKRNDPSVSAMRRQIDDVGKDLETRRAALRAKFSEAQSGVSLTQVAQIDKQAHLLEEYGRQLEEEAARLDEETKSLNVTSLDLQTEQDEIELMRDTATKLGSEFEQMEVELKAPKRVVVIDRAKVPRKKDEIKRIRNTGAAAAGALACILAGVSFWEFQARRISTVDQVARGLGLRVVGSLPSLPGSSRRSLSGPRVTEEDWQSLMVESVDAARAMFLHASRTEGLRSVMITSAMPGEGKTSVTSHLAASLARSGRRVLLMDCDLRRPSIDRLFDLPDSSGLCEIFRGELALVDAIQPTEAVNLSVLPAGRVDPVALEALGRGDLQGVLDAAESQYDFVIIDSAPVLPVADTLLLSQHVDAVIFAILHGVSRMPLVQAASNKLVMLGVRVLGAVVAGTQDTPGGAGYRYAQTYGRKVESIDS
jgi:capsular exopolysaccharide synthesis family protein